MSSSLDAELERLSCSALVALGAHGESADVAWYTGGAKLGDALVVHPRGGGARLAYVTPMERDEAAATGLELLTPERLDLARLTREAPEPADFLAGFVARALEWSGVAPGAVALAGSWPAGAVVAACARLAAAGWSFVDGNEALRRVRKKKQAEELREIRRVTAAVGEAFAAVAALLAAAQIAPDGELRLASEPLTVGRLKQEIARVFAGHELSQPRGNIVSPAEEGGVPHTAGTPTRALRAGESLVVDLYPRGRLFSDATRTFCVGPVPAALARAHADVAAALALAHAQTRPGARGWDLQEAVCGLLAERGWPTPVSTPGTLRGYVHNLGHGVGLELHEYPSFRREALAAPEGRLEAGDVVTLEPGLYEPDGDGFGVRLEDLVVLDEDGAENLTPWPYDLDPRAWARR